jgi:DNA-binding GntR family transcriptional regulator
MKMKPARGGALYRVIADQLGADIERGRYALGAQLPTEHELALRFKTSRQTVRESLRILAEQGLILRRAGTGTTVINTSPRATFAVSPGDLAHLLSYPETVIRKHLRSEHVVADARTAALLGCEPGWPWLRVAALRYAAGRREPLCWVDLYVLPRYAAVAKSRDAERAPLVEQIEARYGEKVESAEVDVFVSRLEADKATALKAEPGSPALTVVRRYIGASGQPFEITVSLHPEARYTYRIKLRKAAR